MTNWREFFQSLPSEPDRPTRRHAWDLPEEYHYTTWTGERTVAAIERSVAARAPFFIWSSFQDPHPPYVVSEPWASMYRPEDMVPGVFTAGEFEAMPPHFRKTQQVDSDFSMYHETYGPHGFRSHVIDEQALREDMAVYYGMISFVDKQIGLILDSLDRLGIAENTMVVFTTDHGHFLGQHGLIAKGAFHYEDMIRIPMIVRCPNGQVRNITCSAMQSQVDFSPTFLHAAGCDVPGFMQGVSQLDVWRRGGGSVRDHIIVENRHEPTKVHLRTYVNERYKITVYRDDAFGELFDLRDDPGEVNNLWANRDYADLKCRLLHRFTQAELQREPTRMPRVAGA